MAKVVIYLGRQERDALQQLAQREMRVPRAQAALIIRQELMRQGMLQEETETLESMLQAKVQEGQP